jgi:ubiquinone/menaquinone biosynthesis C-methylase UbiE
VALKDIIENRQRMDFGTKFRLLGLSLKENGVLWTAQMGTYYFASNIAERAYGYASRRRERLGLPGMNSPQMNKFIWDHWDWSAKGEEWSMSPEWKHSVVRTLLIPNVPEGAVAVEIGPGAGRWTEDLIRRTRKLTAIDISETCVKECRERFASAANAEFIVGTGADLRPVATGSADAIWSFDVFVHINKPQFKAYVAEFARVLKPGGRGVIQHGSVGGKLGGWRSDVTKEQAREFFRAEGLVVKDQISSWFDDGQEHKSGLYDDVVTVFSKPGT